MSAHDNNTYSRGCRCQECRIAHRLYTRALRAAAKARLEASGVDVVEGIKHGVGGYENFSCRCATCRTAKQAADRKRRGRGAA